MVRRLIIDFVVREWRTYALGFVVTLMVWVVLAKPGMPEGATLVWRASDGTLVAMAMTAAFCMGPAITTQLLRREVFLLPVSPRELWLARWWLAVVAAALFAAVPNVLVPRAGMFFTLLIVLCATAYAGVIMALSSLLNVRPRGTRRVRVAVRRGQLVLGLLLAVGGFGWAFLLRPWVPTAPEHLAGPAGLLLGAALVVTLAGYLHAPGPEVPALAKRREWEAAGREHAGQAMRRQSHFTGISFLLWSDVRISLAYGVWVLGILAAFSLLTSPAGTSHIHRVVTSVMPTPGGPIAAIGWLVLLVSCAPAGFRWREAMRHVRTLPLSTWTLASMLVSVPLSRWLAIWALAGMLAALDPSVSVAFRPDVLLAFVGIGAAVQAAGLRWSGSRPAQVVLGTLVFAIGMITLGTYLVSVLDVPARFGDYLPTLVGVFTLVPAVLLNLHTLTRRSATFRRVPITALGQ